jgi:hypothetical protein
MVINYLQSPEKFLAALSVRQFGESAGKMMYKAWEELEKAMDVWNDMADNPLSGSHFALSIGTTDGIPRPILPDIAEKYNGFIDILISVEPFKRELLQKFKEPVLLNKMRLMSIHLEQAAAYAKQATAEASDNEFIGLCYYERVNGRPTCKEYAELNYSSIAIAAELCQQRCDMLCAVHLLTDLENARTTGNEELAGTKQKQYFELIREDISVQERFRDLLVGFAETRPNYKRVNMKDNEISDLLLTTRTKIDILKEYLESGKYLAFEEIPKNDRYRFSWAYMEGLI